MYEQGAKVFTAGEYMQQTDRTSLMSVVDDGACSEKLDCDVSSVFNLASGFEVTPDEDHIWFDNADVRASLDVNNIAVQLIITDQSTGVTYCVKRAGSETGPSTDPLIAVAENDCLMEPVTTTADAPLIGSDDLIFSVDNPEQLLLNCSDSFQDRSHLQKSSVVECESPLSDHHNDQSLTKVYSVSDKVVLSRAKATLPDTYLNIASIDEGNICGVFAKKNLLKGTQFGPLYGTLTELHSSLVRNMHYPIECEDGIVRFLDVSDEEASNWMRFVRKANTLSEQNCVVSQVESHVFFTASRHIRCNEELRVWYSAEYSTRHSLPQLTDSTCENDDNYQEFVHPSALEAVQEPVNRNYIKKVNNKTTRQQCNNSVTKNGGSYIEIALFQCSQCLQMFSSCSRTALKYHFLQRHPSCKFTLNKCFTKIMSFKCNVCKVVFSNAQLLQVHRASHDEKSLDLARIMSCPNCDVTFSQQTQLFQHILQQHSIIYTELIQPEMFTCDICHKVFALRDRLRRHMNVHGSDELKPYQCDQCKRKFLNSSALAGHVKTHLTDVQVYECPICNERFKTLSSMKAHVSTHCQDNQYICPHCKRAFTKYMMIRKHIRTYHSLVKHSCTQCDKEFPSLNKLRLHQLRHSDRREFLCSVCGQQFKRKDKLKEHCKRLHSSGSCNEEKGRRKQHSRKRKGRVICSNSTGDFERFIYKCNSCVIGFKRRGMLVNHLASKHPDIHPDTVLELKLPILQATCNYYCQYCDKVYKSNSKRKAHIRKHHSDVDSIEGPTAGVAQRSSATDLSAFSQMVGSVTISPQQCTWCHRQYASKAKLLQHQRLKHASEGSTSSQPLQQCANVPETNSVPLSNIGNTSLESDTLQAGITVDSINVSQLICFQTDFY